MCKPKIFEYEGKAFMYKKLADHMERKASICNMEDWNENQQYMMNNFQKGNYALSDESFIL